MQNTMIRASSNIILFSNLPLLQLYGLHQKDAYHTYILSTVTTLDKKNLTEALGFSQNVTLIQETCFAHLTRKNLQLTAAELISM